MKRLTFGLAIATASMFMDVDIPNHIALAQSTAGFEALGAGANHPASPAALQKVLNGRLKLANARSDEERTLAQRDLRQALTEYFTLDMRKRTQDLDAIKSRLAAMQSHLDKRVSAKEDILELQLQSFAYEAKGLGLFDVDSLTWMNAAFAEKTGRNYDSHWGQELEPADDAAGMMEIEVEDVHGSTGFEALGSVSLDTQAGAKQRISELRKQLRDVATDQRKSALMKDLKLAMAKHFDAGISKRTLELRGIDERVADLEQHLAKRKAAKDEIITLQIRMFAREADGLGFFLKTPRSSPNTQSRSAAKYRSDKSIANDVISRINSLKAVGQVRAFGVDVVVEDGTVTLTGNVATDEQLDVLGSEVLKVPGVKKLVNEVAVRRIAIVH